MDEQCTDWLKNLPGSGLPPAMQALLAQDIQHLRWLIANAAMLGGARVAREGERLVGSLLVAMPQVAETVRQPWGVRLGKWALTVAAFSGFMTATADAIESTGRVIQEITPAVTGVVDLVDDVSDGA